MASLPPWAVTRLFCIWWEEMALMRFELYTLQKRRRTCSNSRLEEQREDGRNFLPPIQGGYFRALDEIECEKEEAQSSSSSTAPPSPVFDPVEDTTLRPERLCRYKLDIFHLLNSGRSRETGVEADVYLQQPLQRRPQLPFPRRPLPRLDR